jgi:hypothetical protein
MLIGALKQASRAAVSAAHLAYRKPPAHDLFIA